MSGWIYVITNDAMPNLLKVGYTTNTPDVRAKELAGSGIPYQFKVAYAVYVKDPYIKEQQLHKYLQKYHANKEWFNTTPEVVAALIKHKYGKEIIKEDKRFLSTQEILDRTRDIEKKEHELDLVKAEAKRNSEKQNEIRREGELRQKDREKAIRSNMWLYAMIGGGIGIFGGGVGVVFGALLGGFVALFTYDSEPGAIKPYNKYKNE